MANWKLYNHLKKLFLAKRMTAMSVNMKKSVTLALVTVCIFIIIKWEVCALNFQFTRIYFISTITYYVIIFGKTSLNDNVSDDELHLNYSIFRCDRNPDTSIHKRGGGVLIAVRDGLLCSRVRPFSPAVKHLFVKISILF